MRFVYTRIIVIIALFSFLCGFTACTSIPKSSQYFLKNEGAPLSLSDRPDYENINGEFPDSIYIKTQTQTFSFDYEYLIFNGRIYYKERGTDKTAWQLFLETGLPFSKNNKFEEVKRIVEIAADADVLYAFSDKGQLYRCYTKKITSYTPFEWVDYFGWPIKMPLYQNDVVKNKKAWAVGSSRLDVEYYEDIYGNQHNYGPLGVESIPFLCEDGQTIHYSDPACPSDLSHSFRTPDNVVLENISESASTFFAITKEGELYTRLVDYNTVGSDPMLYDYSYNEVYSSIPGGDKRSNTTTWALPNQSWQLQPPLPDGAKSSIYITIIQTGKGNSARELRVAALSPQAKTGYYYKNIDDTQWQFKEVPLILSKNSFIVSKGPEPIDNLQKYYGGLWVNGKQVEDIFCSVEDFHFSEGPCTLNINNQLKIRFYYSEVWTLFLRLNPGYKAESIRYFGTADFDENQLNNSNINPIIKTIFESRNKDIHDFNMEAFDTYLRISLKDKSNVYDFYMTDSGKIVINPDIDCSVIKKTAILEDRLESQKGFFDDKSALYKAEEDINREKKNLAKKLHSVIKTNKGKKHPIVKIISEKVEIILKYSGEICKINEDYYKDNYNLYKRYTDAIISFEEVMNNNADFDAFGVFRDYIIEKTKYAKIDNPYFIEDIAYFPCFVEYTEDGYILYYAKDNAKGIYDYYTGKKDKIMIAKCKFKY